MYFVSGIPEAAIVWKLKSVNAITALVGTRIYPRIAPEGSLYPFIVVDRPPGQSNPQTASGPASLIITPMTIYCVANEKAGGYEKSRAVGRLIKPALNPTGVTGSVIWNGTIIDHCTVSQTYEASAPPQLADEVGWPSEAVDIELFHLDCDSSS